MAALHQHLPTVCTRDPEHDGPCNGIPARTCRVESWAGHHAALIKRQLDGAFASSEAAHTMAKAGFLAGYRLALLELIDGSSTRSGIAARASVAELQALANALLER